MALAEVPVNTPPEQRPVQRGYSKSLQPAGYWGASMDATKAQMGAR